MTDDLFYHRAHLIDLDRINDKVLGLIAILFCSLYETVRYFLDPIIQDIRETHQHRSRDIPQLQLIYQFLQIDRYPVFTRSNYHMTFVVNTKVRNTPPRNVVEFFRIFNTPFSHFTT